LASLAPLVLPKPIISDTTGIKEEAKVEPVPSKTKRRPALLAFTISLLILLISAMLWWYVPEVKQNIQSYSTVLVNEERVNVSPQEILSQNDLKSIDTLENESEGSVDSPLNLLADRDNELIAEENAAPNNESDLESGVTEINEKKGALNCVIVVGAFKRESNVKGMEVLLEEKGYQVYTEEINGLTRVGLYSSCMDAQLDSVLAICRSELESGAWVLQ